MRSFIVSQRQNFDRLLALILLWNVAACVFVTLGAPWLTQVAGTTGLRSALPAGWGWLVIGVPTHFAGFLLPLVGVYALYRMRRNLRWHLLAALFYLPQTFAITSPVHVDVWVGAFAATSLQAPMGTAIAFNWVAITLIFAHAGAQLRSQVARVPAVVRGLFSDFWGSPPLSRNALSRRYASIATITAVAFLPFVPLDIFYPSRETSPFLVPHWFEKETVMAWRRLLLLPMTFVIAYAMAFAWAGGPRQPRFSAWRGLVASLLSYLCLGMAVDLMSQWLSDGREPWLRLFVIVFLYLQPIILLVPVVGALAGQWLERNVASRAQDHK